MEERKMNKKTMGSRYHAEEEERKEREISMRPFNHSFTLGHTDKEGNKFCYWCNCLRKEHKMEAVVGNDGKRRVLTVQ